MIGTYEGQTFVNTFHWQKRDHSAISPSDLTALHTGLVATSYGPATNKTFFSAFYRNCDSDLSVTTVIYRGVTGAGSPELTRTVTSHGDATGTNAAAMLSLVVRYSTGLSGRANRGRNFLSGVNTGMFGTDPDYLDSALASGLAANVSDAIVHAEGLVEFDGVVYSKKNEEAHQIIGVSTNPMFCVQRRRRPVTFG